MNALEGTGSQKTSQVILESRYLRRISDSGHFECGIRCDPIDRLLTDKAIFPHNIRCFHLVSVFSEKVSQRISIQRD